MSSRDFSRHRKPRRGHYPRDFSRQRMPFHSRPEDLKPKPIGGKCNTLCPFFRCNKGAFFVKTNPRGLKTAFCRWVGDECIGYKCQFAYCAKRSLLPDGRCSQAFSRRGEEEDIVKEATKEDWGEDVRKIIAKKLGKRFLDELD